MVHVYPSVRKPCAREVLLVLGSLSVLALIGALLWDERGISLSIGLGVLAGALAVVSFQPVSGLVACGLCLPLAFHLVPLPRGQFSLLEIAILLTSAGLAIHVVAGGWSQCVMAARQALTPVTVTLPILALLPAALASTAFTEITGHRVEALREIRLTIIEPIAFLGCGLIILQDDRWRRWVVAGVTGAGLIISILAIVEVTRGGGVDAGDLRRATATYSHPNNLGLYLERALLLTLPWMLTERRGWVVWVIPGIEGLALLLTFSRGSYLAVVVGVFTILVLQQRFRLLKFAVAIASGLIALAAIVFRDRLLDIGGSGDQPTRFYIWRSALNMIRDYPLFGVGPDQFLYAYSPRYVEPAAWAERYTSHPHNLELDFWLRTGAIGLACLIALVLGLVAFVRSRLDDVRVDPLSCGAVAMLIAGLVHGLVDNGYFLPDLAAFTMLALAIIITTLPATDRLAATS